MSGFKRGQMVTVHWDSKDFTGTIAEFRSLGRLAVVELTEDTGPGWDPGDWVVVPARRLAAIGATRKTGD